MTTALIRAMNETKAIYDHAYRMGVGMKASGLSFYDVGPAMQSSSYGQGADFSANKKRYGDFHGWVYSAVHAIAKAGAARQVNLGMTTKKDDKKPSRTKSHIANRMTDSARAKAASEEYEVIYDHPFLAAMEKPNPIQGRWQFVYSFICNLCLTGWAYIVADEVEEEGYQFFSVPTTWVKPLHEKGPYSEFKIVNPNNPESHSDDSKPLDRSRVAFAYIPHPGNMFRALAPIQAQDRAIKIDSHIQGSQEIFFNKGVFPSVILTMGSNPLPDVAKGEFRPRLSEFQKRQIRLAIKKEMQGVANYGNPAIIDGLIENIERLSATSNEMGWEKSDKINRTRILSAFGVHPFILGEEVAGSYAQSYNVKEVFYDGVNTYLDMLGSCMTHFAGVLTGEENLLVWWTPCKAVDPAQESSQWTQARLRDDVSQNEWRAYMDLPPDEDNNQNVIGKNAKDVLAVASQVKGGQLTPEQGMAILVALGLPDDVAKEIAGDGPTEEDKAKQQAMMDQTQQQKPNGQQQEAEPKTAEEEVVEQVEKAIELMRRPLVVDVKEVDGLVGGILKNCGIGSEGFQQGNTCARGGGGSSSGGTKQTAAGEVLHAVTRGEDKVWRTADGKAPEHIQKLAIPPAWKEVHVNLNPKGNVMATGIDAKGRGQTRYSDNHTMKAAANKFARVSELRAKRKEIFGEIENDLKSGDKKLKEDALCCKLIMKTGMRPGSDADTGADYKSYGATTLEGRHIIPKADGTVTIRFVPGKKKGQEIEMQVTDKRLASQLAAKAKKVGSDGRLFNTTAGRVGNYSRSKDGKGFKTKDHRTALGTETAINVIKSMPKPKTKKEYKAQVKQVSTAVSDLLGNTPSIAFKSYIDPQVWTSWTKSAKIK